MGLKAEAAPPSTEHTEFGPMYSVNTCPSPGRRLLLPDPPRLPLHPRPLLLRGRLNGSNKARGLSALDIGLPRPAPTHFAVVVLR